MNDVIQPRSSQSPYLALDLRSLGLFRIGLALVLLIDLLHRAASLRAHYTGEGILPLNPFQSDFAKPYFWSLHFLSDSFAFQVLLFVLSSLFALALLLGYRTWWANLLSWILICSIQMRNPLIGQFGDVVLRLGLFWGLFLPLGACFSLDRQNTQRDPPLHFTGGIAWAFILQLAFVYWFTAILKTGPDWWSEGSAVYYALSYETLAKPLGLWLTQFPGLLKFLTYLTLVVEILAPLLVFSPWHRGLLRTLAVALMLGFHLSLWLTLHLGIFPWICMAAWLAILPSEFWSHLPSTDGRLRGPGMPRNIPGARRELRVHRSRWLHGLALFLIAYLFLWNLRTVKFDWVASWFPYRANRLGETLRLEQRWGMYAPQPSKTGGWLLVRARLTDGTELNLWPQPKKFSWNKPQSVAASFQGDRWGNYLTRIWDEDYEAYRPQLAHYLQTQYENKHPTSSKIEELEIIQMQQITQDYPQAPTLKSVSLYKKTF